MRTVSVQFELVGTTSSKDGIPKYEWDVLHALRNVMHRMLNTAMSEWHRAELRASKRDPEKVVKDGSQVRTSVYDLLERERAYWAGQADKLENAVEKLRPRATAARSKGDETLAEQREKELSDIIRQLERARIKAALRPNSYIVDTVTTLAGKKHSSYMKDAFRGTSSIPSYRDGSAILWRNQGWTLSRSEKAGVYEIDLPLQSLEGRKVERATFRAIPDGPSMHAFARQMTDPQALESGEAKLGDIRLVYSEKKKKWFAKVTVQVPRRAKVRPGETAALRRGMNNAFVLIFEDGEADLMEGGDVIAFKKKHAERRKAIGRHLRSLELGGGARGRGKKRRFAALTRLDASEERFVDWRCKTWASHIAKKLHQQGVSKLLVAKASPKEFTDSIDNERLQALLHQWPFAKLGDKIRQACEKAGIEYVEVEVGHNARRCPSCGHTHGARQLGTFTCEVCDFKRPSDTIVAWNLLLDAVGKAPLEKSEKARKKFISSVTGSLKENQANGV